VISISPLVAWPAVNAAGARVAASWIGTKAGAAAGGPAIARLRRRPWPPSRVSFHFQKLNVPVRSRRCRQNAI